MGVACNGQAAFRVLAISNCYTNFYFQSKEIIMFLEQLWVYYRFF
jgi:hypothetical protein